MQPYLFSALLFLAFAGAQSTPRAPVEEAVQVIPKFERAACPFDPPRWTGGRPAECGYLTVPEVRTRSGGRTLRLAVAIYRALEPSQNPPLLLIHGGPGGSGGIQTTLGATLFQSPVGRKRDIVVYDLRGAGLSEPRLCPAFFAGTAPVFNRPTPKERQQGYNDAVRACVAELKDQGVDRSGYSTAVNVTDAIDLRHALGYQSWAIFGVSYGGTLAHELMRLDPQGTHAVVMLSARPPGPTGPAEAALTFQRALEHVFASCAAQADCRAAFPTLSDDFQRVVADLSRSPLKVEVTNATESTTLWLDGERFLRELQELLTDSSAITDVPLVIHELRSGDRQRAARRLVGNGLMAPWFPLGRLIGCNDYGADYAAAVAVARPKMAPTFRIIADDIREHCDIWQPGAARVTREPLISDIPTLILNGEFDPQRTTFQWQGSGGLTHAYVHELPGRGHSSLPAGCPSSIVEQFIENPARAPDASCLTDMNQVAFATGQLAMTTLTFVIASSATSSFVGEWQAEIPPGPSATFELKVDGTKVSGAMKRSANANVTQIIDGRADGNVISFKMRSGDGRRLITFVGTLNGDKIAFTRDVEQLGPPGRPLPGIMGDDGPSSFVASRRQK